MYTSTYSCGVIRTSNMFAYHRRPHVIASWNSHHNKESLIIGVVLIEVMEEDW